MKRLLITLHVTRDTLRDWAACGFLKPQGMCYWSSEKHSYVILLVVRRVRMVVETILGRKFEPISTRVERWSSLTRLPFGHIIRGSVVN